MNARRTPPPGPRFAIRHIPSGKVIAVCRSKAAAARAIRGRRLRDWEVYAKSGAAEKLIASAYINSRRWLNRHDPRARS